MISLPFLGRCSEIVSCRTGEILDCRWLQKEVLCLLENYCTADSHLCNKLKGIVGSGGIKKLKSAFRIESGTVNVNGKDLKEILLRHLIFQTFKFSTFWLFQTMFCFLSKNIWLRIHSKKLGKIFPLLFGLKMNKCKVQRSRRKMWSRFLGKSCLTPKLLLEGRCPRNPGAATAITTSRH